MVNKSWFQVLLKKDVPSHFTMGCVCHSSHCVLVMLSRCYRHILKFVWDITSHFSRSSKRIQDFTVMQDVTNTENHKIPKLAQTRWLSRGNAIKVILEQCDALLLYFKSESKFDKIALYQAMKNAGTKHLLLFLNNTLENLTLWILNSNLIIWVSMCCIIWYIQNTKTFWAVLLKNKSLMKQKYLKLTQVTNSCINN